MIVLSLLWFVLVLPTALTDAPVERPRPAALQPPKKFDLDAIDAYVADLVRTKGFVGLSVAILQDGKSIWAKAYGKSSLQPEVAAATDTPFAIGSVTKQFTCACILLLAEEKKLNIKDPVSKYFPKLTRAHDVTIYDLMTHTSGYPDYYPLDFVDGRMMKSIALSRLVEVYAGGKLDFEPGKRWSYSNTGYIVLGRVVEKVAGEPFGKFLQRRILAPLEMKHARFEPGANVPGVARGYTSFALSPPVRATPEAAGWLDAAGGIHATPTDLALWDQALMGGKVLEPESFRLMTTPRQLTTQKTAEYGCGLAIAKRDGETILAHQGGVSGFIAYNTMIPRTHSAVVLLSNTDYVDPGPLHGMIVGLLLREQEERDGPRVPTVKGLSPREAALNFFHQLQKGKLERVQLGADFNIYLDDEKVRGAAERLKSLGEPDDVEVGRPNERGGMEVVHVKLVFKNTALGGLLYRSPDGKIQQLLLNRE